MKVKFFEGKKKTNIENQINSRMDGNSKADLYEINNKELNLNNINYSKNKKSKKSAKKFTTKKFCNFICSKLCQSNKHSKKFYMKGWRDYLEREGNEASDKPFKILTNLFINDDEAISGLQSIRLNPNLVSENKLRNDLEFYIPQLCTFLLFGEMKDIEEFFVFLCKACNLSFFFAHRVHWFLSAMIEASEEKKDSIIKILKMINTLFKSENEENKNILNKFYLSNSEPYINFIGKNHLYFLYDRNNIPNYNIHSLEKVNKEKLNGFQLDIFNKYNKSKDIIFEYSEKEYQNVVFKDKTISAKDKGNKLKNNNESANNNIEKDLSKLSNKLNPDDFLISISNFKLNNPGYSYEEEDDDDIIYENEKEEEEEKNKNNEKKKNPILDINFSSYHSSLNFIDHLCDICNELSKYSNDFQMLYLYGKLLEINKKLPCNAYLPFLKESTRNYLICHIPLEDIKIFRTKTRCPIMLTFELVRIDEINKANQNEDNFLPFETPSPSNKNKKLILLNKIINSSYEKNLYYSTDYDLSKPLMISRSGEIGKSLKKNKTNINRRWLKSTNINIRIFPFHGKKNFDTLNDLEDKDIEEDSKYVDYVSKFMNSPLKSNKSLGKIENSKTLFESLSSRYENEKEEEDNNEFNSTLNDISDKLNIKKKLISNEDNHVDKYDKEEKLEEDEKNNNKSQNIFLKNIRISENEKMNNMDKIEDEVKPISNPINVEELKNIFGEPFLEKEKKLTTKSLFGKLNTYKIFRCIIKTNEDLRQEQFATQLINEFYQIFKLENTGCWLNTYEIISTGKNSGLVEMVNNSLSIDQLKQKTNHISLKDFYINYYGNGSEDSLGFKKAMNNFVSSLAGYSLVCYFLQIKDRHNGNILIDNEGHIIHIDFGFLLSNAPGKGLKFENAPFKLSKDMVECLGGVKGKYFMEFRKLLKKGFLAIHKHREKIIILVEMMWCGHGKQLECFEMGQETIDALKLRLNPKDIISKKNIVKLVDNLIGQSVDNWRTKWYDIFQYYVQGIFY